jgi:hypothetical protein
MCFSFIFGYWFEDVYFIFGWLVILTSWLSFCLRLFFPKISWHCSSWHCSSWRQRTCLSSELGLAWRLALALA